LDEKDEKVENVVTAPSKPVMRSSRHSGGNGG
jgi:hypothetical protein